MHGNPLLPRYLLGDSTVRFFLILLGCFFCGYTATPSFGEQNMLISSTAFEDGASIPRDYSCQGKDISPPLAWTGVPANAKSLVLIVDDPDAPQQTWDHWLLFNISVTVHALPENMTHLPAATKQGINGWGKTGYKGPCPPSGEHRYFFKLYALDMLLALPDGVDKKTLEAAMKNHVLAQATLMGKYKKD